MKIAYNLEDGFVIIEVLDKPDFPHLIITQEIEYDFNNLINPILKNDLSGFEELIIDKEVLITSLKQEYSELISNIEGLKESIERFTFDNTPIPIEIIKKREELKEEYNNRKNEIK